MGFLGRQFRLLAPSPQTKPKGSGACGGLLRSASASHTALRLGFPGFSQHPGRKGELVNDNDK